MNPDVENFLNKLDELKTLVRDTLKEHPKYGLIMSHLEAAQAEVDRIDEGEE